jgi:hypothetical protein
VAGADEVAAVLDGGGRDVARDSPVLRSLPSGS